MGAISGVAAQAALCGRSGALADVAGRRPTLTVLQRVHCQRPAWTCSHRQRVNMHSHASIRRPSIVIPKNYQLALITSIR